MKTSLLTIASLGLGALAPACGGHRYHDDYSNPGYDQCSQAGPGSPLRVDIDTDAPALTTDAGDGAGVFVEYMDGGAYHVFSTCDTNKSGYSCQWAIVASIDPTLSLQVTDDGDLEGDDTITRVDEGAVRLVFNSDADFDGAVLSAPAGEKLRLNVVLDGCYDSSLVSWVSNGSIVSGAPSDPVDFVPTSP
jgi:hypothetical protein